MTRHTTTANPVEGILPPPAVKAGQLIRSGKRIRQELDFHFKFKWPPEILEGLEEFLRTGQIDSLASLLARKPFALFHPVIYCQLLNLYNLVRMWDQEDLAEFIEMGGCIDPKKPILSTETKKAAKESLEKLLRAWVPRMLPGLTVEPAKHKKPRGAKPKMDPDRERDLLIDFYELLHDMQRFTGRNHFDEGDYERKVNESQEAFIKRTMKVVQKVHSCSWRSIETYRDSHEPELNEDWQVWLRGAGPLSTQIARNIAEHAVKKRVVSKKDLLYALFAHYERKPPDAIRGIIERAEADHPKLARQLHT